MGGRNRQPSKQRASENTAHIEGRGYSVRADAPANPGPLGLVLLAASLVCIASLAAQGPVLRSQAVLLDDHQYLTHNPVVQRPSWESARRFLTEVVHPSTVGGYYQPLPMISLMLDFARCGTKEDFRAYHQTNLLLHTVNALLLMWLLTRLLGDPFAAATAAMIFAAHPMMSDSVAWISDRKTLLATAFSFAALLAHVARARRGGAWRLAATTGWFLMALMSKPTAVPLPLMMLALDAWPLKRFTRRAVMEKLPLFAMMAGWAVLTYVSQKSSGGATLPAAPALTRAPLILAYAIVFYPHRLIWPVDLTPYYPIPSPMDWSSTMPVAGFVVVVIIGILLVRYRETTRPIQAAGVTYVLGILPTVGLIGFTDVIVANRFFYLPSLGLWLLLAAGVAHAWRRLNFKQRLSRVVLTFGAVVMLGLWITNDYLKLWRETPTLLAHVMQRSPKSPLAHCMMGEYLLDTLGKPLEAEVEFREALRIDPSFTIAHNNLAATLMEQNRRAEAKAHLEEALRLAPDWHDSLANLAILLAGEGDDAGALAACEKSLRIRPEYAPGHCGMGMILAAQGRFEEAITHYRRALELDSRYALAHDNLGVSLGALGRYDEAIVQFEAALRLRPNMESAKRHLEMARVANRRQGR